MPWWIALKTLATIVALLSGIQLLDLTTSLMPSLVDASWPIRVPGSAEIAVRLALGLPLVFVLYARFHTLRRSVHAWRVPRLPGAIVAVFLGCQLAHVALRYDRFPFSPIAMFSNAVDAPARPADHRPGYAVLIDDRPVLLSFLREGSSWSQALWDLDYKSGWALRIHATAWRRAEAIVMEALAKNPSVTAARRFSKPSLRVRRSDGRRLQAEAWRESLKGSHAPQP